MGDGGEGTMVSLVDETGGTIHDIQVAGPLGNNVLGRFEILGVDLPFGGGTLVNLKTKDLRNFDKRILEVEIEVACHVKNTLTGENGASYVFGLQKGATPEMLKILDNNLQHYSYVIRDTFNIEGAGAALVCFCNGRLTRGIDLVIKYSNLEEKLQGADLVFTGEGSIDFQTKFSKTPIGVSPSGKKNDNPVIAFAGKIGEGIDELYELGIDSVIGIMPGVTTLEEALDKGKENLEISVENISGIIKGLSH